METCTFSQIMDTLTPWLDRDYIRKVYLDSNHNIRLCFTDGGERVFRVDDCSGNQMGDIVERLKAKNIPVEEQKIICS